MVELKLNVSDVDFDSLIHLLAGSMAGPAVLAAKMVPDSAKEDLVVSYINSNAEKLEQMFQNMLAGKGVNLKISGAKAMKIG